MRIVSLLPSSTEIVCALGFTDQLVGRSHECDFPVDATQAEICTEAKLDSSFSSREIDNSVKNLLQDGLSLYQVFDDKLKKLDPDIIITQSQCEVCAVSLNDVEKAVSEWCRKETKIISLQPNTLMDIWEDIGTVSQALDVVGQGAQLVADLSERMGHVAQKVKNIKNRPTVACIEWIEPLMAAGNWVPELVEMAGGENLFGQAGKHSDWMEFNELLEADPDIIIAMPCGFGLDRTRKEIKSIIDHPSWEKLSAVKNDKVFITDGNQYFNRPGPRLVESLEILSEIFYPDEFGYSHEGLGWEEL